MCLLTDKYIYKIDLANFLKTNDRNVVMKINLCNNAFIDL